MKAFKFYAPKTNFGRTDRRVLYSPAFAKGGRQQYNNTIRHLNDILALNNDYFIICIINIYPVKVNIDNK